MYIKNIKIQHHVEFEAYRTNRLVVNDIRMKSKCGYQNESIGQSYIITHTQMYALQIYHLVKFEAHGK